MKNLNQKGITLIALIITIIVLLILAGITISLTIGNRGIVNHAEQAGIKSEEASAREKLELALLDLQAEKVTNVAYNENEYIDNYLSKQNMVVNGDIVFVDGWQFQIDRKVPKIIASLGKGQPNEEIKVSVTQTASSDFVKSTIKAEIEYTGEIIYIQIAGEEIEVPLKQGGKYIIEKEVTQNGNYSILVKDKEEKYQIATIEVSEISEDMTIKTAEELVAFRDKVNQGATYEGRIVKLDADINLNEGKYSLNEDGSVTFTSDAIQWIPIGNEPMKVFRGTFDGQNHVIKGIYIDNENIVQGLFGRNLGTIKNTIVDCGYIVAGNKIGGITGYNDGTLENNINKLTLEAKTANETGNSFIGGICGYCATGNITNSINYGNIKATGANVGGICGYIDSSEYKVTNCKNLSSTIITTGADTRSGASKIGGICGYSYSKIEKCYNKAQIIGAKGNVGGIVGSGHGIINSCNIGNVQSLGTNINGNNTIGGIAGFSYENIENCYNTGNVTATSKIVGGIAGSTVDGTVKKLIKNSYNVGVISAKPYSGGITGNGVSQNSYYLSGTAKYGIGGSTATTGSNTGATSKTSEQLKALATTIGTAYTNDIQNEDGTWKYNNGYPILKWQVEQ